MGELKRNPVGFIALWLQMLWNKMASTGHGYRHPSLKHTGKGQDRRPDKLGGEPSLLRRYRNRYS